MFEKINAMTEHIDIEKLYLHWLQMSDRDFETMHTLYRAGDFTWALFIGHIVLEKLLKAVVVKKTKAHAPFTHDLTRLSTFTELDFSDEQLDWLDTITTFNINARYDSYKELFYKKCDAAFTAKWIANIDALRLWIREKQ